MSASRMGIVHVSCDDWNALYIDGKLFREGHSIHMEDWFDAIETLTGGRPQSVEADDEWLLALGSYPKALADVKETP
jgi:hypothetical protein